MDNQNINKEQIWSLIKKLFPIHRTLINDGFDSSLDIINKELELIIKSYKSGEKVWDWIIPDAWNVNEAYIEDKDGNKLVDYNNSNLHLSAYSEPFSGKITHAELLAHLNYLTDLPDAIPYNFLYYEKDWSFNIKYNSLADFKDEEYKILFSEQFQYKGFIEALLSTIRNFNLFSVLEMYSSIGETQKPVLAIWGKLDGVVPFSGSEKLKQAIPQAELVVIEEGTHDITYRQPSQVSKAIVRFLLKQKRVSR